MRIETGWHTKNTYYVVKPLHNGCRQELVMYGFRAGNRWYIAAGIFSVNVTYHSLELSKVWDAPTSTNKNPSISTLRLALEALKEIENAITEDAKGKRRFVYIDGMDERRLRVYTKVLAKEKYGYKKSSVKSKYSNLPLLYKGL